MVHDAAGGRFIRRFDQTGIDDVPLVGGKNASLGEMFRELTSGREGPVPTLLATGLPVVLGDPQQFEQLFQNLLSNALKFVEPGRAPGGKDA